ncbi:LuxR C-terminal-related transcriptional regulator [Phormidesmis sp. 146-12]
MRDAMRLLTRLQKFTHAGGRTIRVMETLLLQALVLQAQGDRTRSFDFLHQALNIPSQGKYIRLFSDEGKPMAELLQIAVFQDIHADAAKRLLTIFNSVEEKESTIIQPFVEPLSARELEVLRYLATGMSNQAIADQLFVSLAAVK